MHEIQPDLAHVRHVEILLVDDDDDDVLLMEKSLRKDRVLNRIHRVEDGVEAMAFLRREGKYADAVRPDLILLDLNMPRKDGREVLKEIKDDKSLESIPVIVLTMSADDCDVLESYRQRASSFVSKPVDLMQFREILQVLRDYWICVVRLPPSS